MPKPRKPPVRKRQSVTITLSPDTMRLLGYFTANAESNRSVAIEATISRYSYLLETVSLSVLTRIKFKLLLQAMDGVGNSNVIDAKQRLEFSVAYAIRQNDASAAEVREGRFANFNQEGQEALLEQISQERKLIEELGEDVRQFSHVQSMALLARVEEFQGMDHDNADGNCDFIYNKIRRQTLI